MKIINHDQGRSMLKDLNRFFNRGKAQGADAKPETGDSFTKTPEVQEKPVKPVEGSEGAGKDLNVSFQFNLFYELSQKVEKKMGQSGSQKFSEVSTSVAETFEGSFNLKIDGLGSFFKNTDSALNISEETTNEFFDSVEGLADLSPEALENFLAESEDFFAELEDKFGEAGGAFDQIKDQMQQQASAFFSGVRAIRGQEGGSENQIETNPEAEVAAVENSAGDVDQALAALNSEQSKTDSTSELIKMANKPDMMVSKEKYQEFLQSFIEYSERFRQEMFSGLLSNNGSDKNTTGSILSQA
ncbi:MAG: hypothetical protein ACQETH_11875 [Candidatus Rifleibacteriota bacterium]